MKAAFQVKTCVCGVLLLCTAMGTAALTLGRAQGAIFVGKPLDLRVQLQAEASEELQSGCMGADVFYGESLVDAARVAVSIDDPPSATGKGPTMRVTASALIDEPIVTVNIRVGCQQKSSRRYTLFPDVTTNVVEPPARVVPRTAALATDLTLPVVVSGTTSPGAAAVDSRRTERPAKRAQADARSADIPAISKTPSPTPVVKPARSSPTLATPMAPVSRAKLAAGPSGKSRLKLDPLDLQIDHDPVLQATTELLTLPQQSAAVRAEAAALWRALNASPEERLLDEAKTRALEKDLKALYTVTAENQKGLVELVAKVQHAESQRYANALVYTLAALCMLLLLALVWVWRRARVARPTNWMQGVEGADSLMAELVKAPSISRPVPPTPAPTAAAPAVQLATVSPPSMPAELDFDLDAFESLPQPTVPYERVPASRAEVPVPPSVAPTSHTPPGAVTHVTGRDFSVSVAGGLRAIDSAELLDVRQQADFFVALGEHQKAIDVLTTRIAQVGESSPLVCLDLLKLYHKLGRESEFEFMRQEFNNWFTGRVPVIDDFGNEGRSLEKYPKVIDQIVALWPDPRVLEYIENCIYHHSTDVYEPDFDLLAYRELLLLHGIAKQIVRLPDGATDSHAAGLVRIAARAPSGAPPEMLGNGEVPHRVGAQHRGAWKRTPARHASQLPDPQADMETRGTPLSSMRVPLAPVVTPGPIDVMLDADGEIDPGPTTDFGFPGSR